MSSPEDLAKDIAFAKKYAPTAEALAILDKKSNEIIATGLIWQPDPNFIQKMVKTVKQAQALELQKLL